MSITGGGAPDGRTAIPTRPAAASATKALSAGFPGSTALSRRRSACPARQRVFPAVSTISPPCAQRPQDRHASPKHDRHQCRYNPFTGGIGNALKDPSPPCLQPHGAASDRRRPTALSTWDRPTTIRPAPSWARFRTALPSPRSTTASWPPRDFVNPSANYATLQRRSLPPAGTTGTAITADTLAQPVTSEADALNDIVPRFRRPARRLQHPRCAGFQRPQRPAALGHHRKRRRTEQPRSAAEARQRYGDERADARQLADPDRRWAYDPSTRSSRPLGIGAARPTPSRRSCALKIRCKPSRRPSRSLAPTRTSRAAM